MKPIVYDHRNGSKVVPDKIVNEIKNVLSSISPELEKNTVKILKNRI